MITFRMLGGVELRDSSGDELRSVLAQPKRLALLSYLAHSGSRTFNSRDTLLGLLWPESDEERGRAALSQSLYYLRQALGPEVLISRGGDEVGVDPDRLWCDTVAFEQALERGDPIAALELYRGDFLTGLFLADGVEWERWVQDERSRLRDRAAEAARGLCEQLQQQNRPHEAVHWARRALALSEDNEDDLRALITLLDHLGERAAAVRTYEEFARVLARDYGVEVSPETRALIEQVRERDASVRTDNGGGERPGPAATPTPPGPRSPSRRSHRRKALVLGGVALGALLLITAFQQFWSSDEASTDHAPESGMIEVGSRIAVLPFANLTPTAEDEYLADGMTEELISRLSRVTGLRVIARTSVMPYRDAAQSVFDIGRELSVQYVIEGSVRRSEDRMRITVQLIETKTEQHLWAQTYEGDIEELLDVQREIAEAVARTLPIRFPEIERRRVVERGTEDAAAHLLYLRGRHLLGRGDPESFEQARLLFEQAIERDPDYARAWSGLSDALDRLVWARVARPTEAYPRARDAAERALELNPDLAEAHASLARALTAYVWDPEAAEHHFRRAIELDPSDARAHRTYSSHLLHQGRRAEGRAEAETAVELDPLSFFSHFQLLFVAFFEGRYDEAIERGEALKAMGSNPRSAHFMLAKVHAEMGHHDEALAELDRADPHHRFHPAIATRGLIYGRVGRRAEALAALAALDSLSLERDVDFDRALVHLGLGDNDRTLELLRAAVETRDWRLRLLAAEPIFQPLHGEPEYHALLARVGLGGADLHPGPR